MIDQLKRMATFAAIVEHGSFVGAARALGTTTSAVSQHIRALEKEVGVTLLVRSTRQVALTTAGQRFHEGCADMVAAARRAGQTLLEMRDAPVGELRVTAPAGFARVLGQALMPLLHHHPQLSLHLLADDAHTDLVAERIDLALRFGRLPDSSWVAQPLGFLRMHLCAAPSYLTRRGIPVHPDDLAGHDAVQLNTGRLPNHLNLLNPSGVEVPVKAAWRSRLSSNSQSWVQHMCEAGMGLAVLAAHDTVDILHEGRVVPVLPGWSLPPLPIYALTPQRGAQPAKVRLALEALLAHMAQWPASVYSPRQEGLHW
ncbi:LysR substrate-binding domain-containing protein [Aquabacterium sp.]|uniref:LysR family transcriptional regulator n=1 Tax=Aquabacterium sp. TaxID=1872578 RepID=UPI003D6D35BE